MILFIFINEFLNCYSAPEQEWNKLLIDGLAVGKGEISAEDFYAVIKKRIERTLIRTVRDTLCLDFLLAVDSLFFPFHSTNLCLRREARTSNVF